MKTMTIPLPLLGANCYILSNNMSQAIIIDPGGEPDTVVKYIEENNLKPTHIYLTHGHFDHIGGVVALKKRYNLPILIHPQDLAILSMASASARYFEIDCANPPEPDGYFDSEETIAFGEVDINVIFTPGHTPGSVCFYIKNEYCVYTGDTLFYEGIGRTDLPGGNSKSIIKSIQNKLYALHDDTRVFPGHGKPTSVGYEARCNPFVRRGMNAG